MFSGGEKIITQQYININTIERLEFLPSEQHRDVEPGCPKGEENQQRKADAAH